MSRNGAWRSLVAHLVWGPGGRWFESSRSDQNNAEGFQHSRSPFFLPVVLPFAAFGLLPRISASPVSRRVLSLRPHCHPPHRRARICLSSLSCKAPHASHRNNHCFAPLRLLCSWERHVTGGLGYAYLPESVPFSGSDGFHCLRRGEFSLRPLKRLLPPPPGTA